MGFARTPSRQVIEAAKHASIVTFIGEREIDAVMRSTDPFGVDDRCELSPTHRHYGIGSCGDVVCCYCSRIFWR